MNEASDHARRVAFATWIRDRLGRLALDERALEPVVHRSSGWLRRFEAGDGDDDLTWIEAWRLIELLGGDPPKVIRALPGGAQVQRDDRSETTREVERS